MRDAEFLWMVEQSLGYDDVKILSESEEGDHFRVCIAATDRVTLLRHRIQFEIVTNADMIVSVVERSEIIEAHRGA